MFFNLAVQNVKKSMKDYLIYFLTLTFGVCLFYVFNSMEGQQAVLALSEDQREILKLTSSVIEVLSIFISFILGFLIIYANQFLIKRRKKELGIYMTLGMEKGHISRILISETMVIGLVSLGVGLLIGVFAAQGMALLSAKLFVVKMKEFVFVFSGKAMLRTILYFGIIYIVVILFNTVAVSRFKLIDLLTAAKKNEQLKVKSLRVSVTLFVLSAISLGVAYYLIIKNGMASPTPGFYASIVLGIIGTFLFFLSLSGFLLRVIKANKKVYFKGLNMFVLRQVNARITTTFISMTFICLMLLVTIGVLSTGAGFANTLGTQLKIATPYDMTLTAYPEGDMDAELTPRDMAKQMQADGVWDAERTKEYSEVSVYTISDVTFKHIMIHTNKQGLLPEKTLERVKKIPLPMITISEYNQAMEMAGKEPIALKDNEVALNANYYDLQEAYKKLVGDQDETISIQGKTYHYYGKLLGDSYYTAPMSMNTGTLIVPDTVVSGAKLNSMYTNINVVGHTEKNQKALDKVYSKYGEETGVFSQCMTRAFAYEQNAGLTVMLSYLAVYIGFVFLITCSAILALQQLSDSSDNQERYNMLRKIGTDEKDIHKAIFMQVAIAFLVPLALAIVHSIVGLNVANKVIANFGYTNAGVGILAAAVGILVIYGGYMLATYQGCKAMVKER
ncbi:FtsX-like permease family protein [Lachnospiraceae bacterium LCP25S3_G4]